MFHILVAEDDKNLRRLMEKYLLRAGYEVFCATDGKEALELLDRVHIDLIVSDIMMPNLDGYQLTEELRQSDSNIPIIMVTAKETMEDKKKGFTAGADDYMVKPIDLEELQLRVAALLRRSKIVSEHKIVIGNVVLDYDAMTVEREGKSVTLPQKEFLLLFQLLSYPNKIFTRQQLMDEIWGFDSNTEDRTVDVHIQRLREKFGNYPEFKIITVRGLGYKAEKEV